MQDPNHNSPRHKRPELTLLARNAIPVLLDVSVAIYRRVEQSKLALAASLADVRRPDIRGQLGLKVGNAPLQTLNLCKRLGGISQGREVFHD